MYPSRQNLKRLDGDRLHNNKSKKIISIKIIVILGSEPALLGNKIVTLPGKREENKGIGGIELSKPNKQSGQIVFSPSTVSSQLHT